MKRLRSRTALSLAVALAAAVVAAVAAVAGEGFSISLYSAPDPPGVRQSGRLLMTLPRRQATDHEFDGSRRDVTGIGLVRDLGARG